MILLCSVAVGMGGVSGHSIDNGLMGPGPKMDDRREGE